jgi:hypothetical protein
MYTHHMPREKTLAFQMRVSPEWFAPVDAWRAKQPGIPSRAEAVRRLVAAGLDRYTADEGGTGHDR